MSVSQNAQHGDPETSSPQWNRAIIYPAIISLFFLSLARKKPLL